ncbi:HlyD family efflux transporter periplasmic adaptor subunit [Pseudothauera nasutitermitis]|uniref:HlyD family efflux transporter periplasmic adaptor subunit n=1 Tax=Pseudothauera nasutitermitis TaxID=2565930 RepID=A0A4S4B4L9_9RHOO|nr:HlyD family efflux transporter periplasmic adaptor subunit [Pseudothauera nasutitermitis]THF67241.1 HlyD family efflux transporter periplasmic adaptor subunit [Pseudothauera nasutitermitis]
MNAAAPRPSREDRLAVLLQLERRVRACASEEELAFLMVNDTHALAPYRQAVLWQAQPGGGRIAALSGLAVPDPHAPFNVWLARLLAAHAAQAGAPGALPPPEEGDDAAMWAEHLPPQAWWLPLPTGGDGCGRGAGLLLLREAPWQPAETNLLALFAETCAHAWGALRKHGAERPEGTFAERLRRYARTRRTWLIAAAVLLAALCLPVRQSVLAPAEVVARNPVAVRAPLQGVVDRIPVQPNQRVEAGELLVALDARELEGRLEAARQGLAVAEAELRQGQQQALFDERSKAAVRLLQGRRDQAASEADHLQRALARTQLRAERAGIVIFDDVADWIGKPVALGERIMQIADPDEIELEVLLPVADAIALPHEAPLRLFLNTAPATPLAATLLRVGYRASPTPDGTLAYRVRARFDTGEAARVGLKGTAKLYGERTLLAAYLLRRPLARLRVWLGV